MFTPRYYHQFVRAYRTSCNSIRGFLNDEMGPTAVEYAVMLALIMVVCITAVHSLGLNASTTFSNISSVLAPKGS
jgi:pilus assembly protein Flp/PilA